MVRSTGQLRRSFWDSSRVVARTDATGQIVPNSVTAWATSSQPCPMRRSVPASVSMNLVCQAPIEFRRRTSSIAW